jgi:hypothetical protein
MDEYRLGRTVKQVDALHQYVTNTRNEIIEAGIQCGSPVDGCL